MHFERLAVSFVAVLLAVLSPASAAGSDSQDAQLYPRPKSPLSELFTVPDPKPGVVVPIEPQPLHHAIETEVYLRAEPDFTPRIVCGMKMIEGTADMDPRIVIPIAERHGAKIRVLGPAPCDEFSSGRRVIMPGGTFGTGTRLPDRR